MTTPEPAARSALRSIPLAAPGAYMVVNHGLRPLGSILAGGLGSWIGLRPTLWIAALGAVAGVLWLLPSPMLRLRDLPDRDG